MNIKPLGAIISRNSWFGRHCWAMKRASVWGWGCVFCSFLFVVWNGEILDEGIWQNHGDSFLRFSEKERREKWMFLSFERPRDVADGSQCHHLWSKRRSEIGNEGAKQHQWAREVTQIARWFDADCRVKWRKSQDEVTQIGNASGVNESSFLVNRSHTMSYRKRSFSPFFRPADILFSNTRVLPHLNSKFSWQSQCHRAAALFP